MQDQPKPIPRATFANILPPHRDRCFFENSDRHPFRSHAGQFELVNAWWLAEASLLVYDAERYVEQEIGRAGLQAIKHFTGQSTQCFVAANDDFVIVAFRGTQSYGPDRKADFGGMLADMLADIDLRLVASHQGGYVHRGFRQALDEIWHDQAGKPGLESYLNQLKQAGGRYRTLWLTGHSLGAALATLAADRYGDVQGVYTFGSPRVGDGAFKAAYHMPTYRFVHHNDVVTHLPLLGPYATLRIPPKGVFHHVGGLRYIDSEGHLRDKPPVVSSLSEKIHGYLGHLFHGHGPSRSGLLGEIPVDGLVDHAPLYYANHIWNRYLAEISDQRTLDLSVEREIP
jgi:triacylglycerol lipase